MSSPTDAEIIDQLGGTGAVAAICGVLPSAVSNWRVDGIPPGRRWQIAEALRGADKAVPEDWYARNVPAPRLGHAGSAA